MAKRPTRKKRRARRQYDDDFKAEAVQMLLDGHTAKSITENLGLGGTSMLYRWKASLIKESGAAATALESRLHQLEEELRRVERERDILKKALAIFSQMQHASARR